MLKVKIPCGTNIHLITVKLRQAETRAGHQGGGPAKRANRPEWPGARGLALRAQAGEAAGRTRCAHRSDLQTNMDAGALRLGSRSWSQRRDSCSGGSSLGPIDGAATADSRSRSAAQHGLGRPLPAPKPTIAVLARPRGPCQAPARPKGPGLGTSPRPTRASSHRTPRTPRPLLPPSPAPASRADHSGPHAAPARRPRRPRPPPAGPAALRAPSSESREPSAGRAARGGGRGGAGAGLPHFLGRKRRRRSPLGPRRGRAAQTWPSGARATRAGSWRSGRTAPT